MEPISAAFLKGFTSAVVAYSTHYGFVKLYSSNCVPDGVWGYFQGFLTAGSPLCQTGVQVIQSTQMTYGSIITMGLTRFVLDIINPFKMGKG